MRIFAVVVLLIGVLHAQTPIQDVSEKGNPLSFAPTVTADDYWDSNITAQNVSNKEILAYAIDFSGLVTGRDLYFNKDVFGPNTTSVLTELPEDFHQPPTIHAHVLWVQFVDGTEWGDPKAGENLLN